MIAILRTIIQEMNDDTSLFRGFVILCVSQLNHLMDESIHPSIIIVLYDDSITNLSIQLVFKTVVKKMKQTVL